MRICSVNLCYKKHWSCGYCRDHYRKWNKLGRPLHWNPSIDIRTRVITLRDIPMIIVPHQFYQITCRVTGCDNKPNNGIYCSEHGSILQEYNDRLELDWTVIINQELCKVPYCHRNDLCAYGLCELHYREWITAGSPKRWEPYWNILVGCKVRDCSRKHHAKGFCAHHYWKWLRGLLPQYAIDTHECIATGCTNLSFKDGRCPRHYARHLQRLAQRRSA